MFVGNMLSTENENFCRYKLQFQEIPQEKNTDDDQQILTLLFQDGNTTKYFTKCTSKRKYDILKVWTNLSKIIWLHFIIILVLSFDSRRHHTKGLWKETFPTFATVRAQGWRPTRYAIVPTNLYTTSISYLTLSILVLPNTNISLRLCPNICGGILLWGCFYMVCSFYLSDLWDAAFAYIPCVCVVVDVQHWTQHAMHPRSDTTICRIAAVCPLCHRTMAAERAAATAGRSPTARATAM